MANTHQFKGLQDWVEVFKAGDHVDSKGRAISFTEADLDQMVANVALAAAPAVLGHPKHNDPAYGWANEARRDGASLFVKFADLNPAFEAGVASGAYRNRSVSVHKDPAHGWQVRHVGWLGAAPPAISGLKALDFTAAPADLHEFADQADMDIGYALDDIASVLRNLREQLIAKDGIDAADVALPSWRIDSLTATAARVREAARTDDDTGFPAFNQPNPGAHMSFTQADIDQAVSKAKTDAADAARAALTAEFTASNATQAAELARLQGERRAERIGTQLAAWKAAGLVTPAEERGMAEFMAALEAQPAQFEFTAADGKPAKTEPTQWFAEFVASRKPVVKLGARTDGALPGQVDMGSAEAIVTAATAFQFSQSAKGITVSIDQAVQHVKDTNTTHTGAR